MCKPNRASKYESINPLIQDGELAAYRPNVPRHIVFSGLWKHSGKIFKSNISSNLSQ